MPARNETRKENVAEHPKPCPDCGNPLARVDCLPLIEEKEGRRLIKVIPVPPEEALYHCPKCRLLFKYRRQKMIQIGYDEALKMVTPQQKFAPAQIRDSKFLVDPRFTMMHTGPGAGKEHPAIRCRGLSDEEIVRVMREEYGIEVNPEFVRFLKRRWWGTG